eukprot:31399-Pelagococcus_subviridis.AAC.8
MRRERKSSRNEVHNADAVVRGPVSATPRTRLIDELVPAVVPRARIPLAVLVRHHAPERVHDGPRREVLGRDQLQAFPLPAFLLFDDLVHLGVHLRERLVARLWPRHVRLVADELLVLVRVGALRWIGFWGAGGGGASELG